MLCLLYWLPSCDGARPLSLLNELLFILTRSRRREGFFFSTTSATCNQVKAKTKQVNSMLSFEWHDKLILEKFWSTKILFSIIVELQMHPYDAFDIIQRFYLRDFSWWDATVSLKFKGQHTIGVKSLQHDVGTISLCVHMMQQYIFTHFVTATGPTNSNQQGQNSVMEFSKEFHNTQEGNCHSNVSSHHVAATSCLVCWP